MGNGGSMENDDRQLFICNCENTMPLRGDALAKACGKDGSAKIHSQLCRAQIGDLQSTAASGAAITIACTQEAPLFEEILEEAGYEGDARFVNIRETAGWSDQAAKATPKIAALLAESAVAVKPAPSVTMQSEGACLVYGRDETAIEAARQLADRLDVTVLLTKPAEIVPPQVMDVPIFKGTIAGAKGHFGAFEIIVDDYAPSVVSARGAMAFEAPRNGAASKCDLILDLCGGTPLFTASEKRDGYFRPDPGDPAAVQRALFELSDLNGEFEKPLYVKFDADICAHSRSRKQGCTRCLEVCPTGAIAPAGDVVEFDPFVCAGCGSCSAVCPTGAAGYAVPAATDIMERLRVLLTSYRTAGGEAPILLIHDEKHGAPLIGLVARFGAGLPANVIPFAVTEVTQVGFDIISAAYAYGTSQVLLLASPQQQSELAGLASQIGMAEAVMEGLGYGGGRTDLLIETDPDALAGRLGQLTARNQAETASFLLMSGKRTNTRMAVEHLHAKAPAPIDVLPLPGGAAFGSVEIGAEGCTLCLACVSTCPTGALIDNPDKPQLSFQESACIQCGLCVATCPESVMALEPRMNFTPDARNAKVVKEEEPFECVSCGKPFGSKGSIEKIVEKLGNKHSMFQNPEAIERIKMCEDCRVVSQFQAKDSPFVSGDRPIPKTTDDYLREREIEEARAKVKAERENEN
ncbi:4Fe-4S dicluster domain-containing protein [Pelagibius sp. Alg239-R121]|uniref:4Fe-4S dicluster domain-containing protein n=1 Tax=Pelagibius sp. Alg239-R121 TaxID=2993448 RepID=UPI0024A60B45|nr:4Fe-4S dicluster domain-containing protein [Pelagibius sp. Alg239-R121]